MAKIKIDIETAEAVILKIRNKVNDIDRGCEKLNYAVEMNKEINKIEYKPWYTNSRLGSRYGISEKRRNNAYHERYQRLLDETCKVVQHHIESFKLYMAACESGTSYYCEALTSFVPRIVSTQNDHMDMINNIPTIESYGADHIKKLSNTKLMYAISASAMSGADDAFIHELIDELYDKRILVMGRTSKNHYQAAINNDVLSAFYIFYLNNTSQEAKNQFHAYFSAEVNAHVDMDVFSANILALLNLDIPEGVDTRFLEIEPLYSKHENKDQSSVYKLLLTITKTVESSDAREAKPTQHLTYHFSVSARTKKDMDFQDIEDELERRWRERVDLVALGKELLSSGILTDKVLGLLGLSTKDIALVQKMADGFNDFVGEDYRKLYKLYVLSTGAFTDIMKYTEYVEHVYSKEVERIDAMARFYGEGIDRLHVTSETNMYGEVRHVLTPTHVQIDQLNRARRGMTPNNTMPDLSYDEVAQHPELFLATLEALYLEYHSSIGFSVAGNGMGLTNEEGKVDTNYGKGDINAPKRNFFSEYNKY